MPQGDRERTVGAMLRLVIVAISVGPADSLNASTADSMVAAIDTTTPALNSRFRSPSAVIA